MMMMTRVRMKFRRAELNFILLRALLRSLEIVGFGTLRRGAERYGDYNTSFCSVENKRLFRVDIS
jgi:hypothetical protein